MRYKHKNFTIKYHCSDGGANIYQVIDNKSKKAVYFGLYTQCVDFVKYEELTQKPTAITININADSQETLVEVFRIDNRTFIGYADNKLGMYYLETNEYFLVNVLAENIVCEEWDRMIEKEDLHRQCTV